MNVIVRLLLNSRGGHYFFSFIKTKRFLEAEDIMWAAINKICEQDAYPILGLAIKRELRLGRNKNLESYDMLSFILSMPSADSKQVWFLFYKQWMQAYYDDQERDPNKVVSVLFDILIKAKAEGLLKDQDMLEVSLFWSLMISVSDSIKKKNITSEANVANFGHLLDYILADENKHLIKKKYLGPLIHSIDLTDLGGTGSLLKKVAKHKLMMDI